MRSYVTKELDGWYIRRTYRNGARIAFGPYRWAWLAEVIMVFSV